MNESSTLPVTLRIHVSGCKQCKDVMCRLKSGGTADAGKKTMVEG